MIVVIFKDKIQYQSEGCKEAQPYRVYVKTSYKRFYGQKDRHLEGVSYRIILNVLSIC